MLGNFKFFQSADLQSKYDYSLLKEARKEPASAAQMKAPSQAKGCPGSKKAPFQKAPFSACIQFWVQV
ncbi:hypothetical protein IB211_00051c [Intestinimonas butyriciproducens]|uniref:Uncharacterized protein n=1 Tax=Intestinimonas butyriciproducens TaxID=1297617 RepID=A0A0S2VZN6_9FIRM|nr:hypothetical protein IB211_00051c [Intestinimonas butyriciproducens]